MLNEFVDFCAEIFPSISPYKIEALKNAMDQFNFEGKTFCVCQSTPLEYLAQGDVFGELPFTYFDDDGEEKLIYRKSILLSNTCDASRRDFLIFAAIQEFETNDNGAEQFSENTIKDIKLNRMSQFLYLPCTELQSEMVDFGLINTFSRNAIIKMINTNTLKKKISLNEYGFYMLLSKLTIYFCRRQDLDTECIRRNECTDASKY